MYPWEPIVKRGGQPGVEFFANSTTTEKESRDIVGNVFIAIAMMIFASVIAILFFWAYQKEKSLFISIFSGMVFLYTIKMIILVAVLRSKLNPIVFKLYIGSTAFMSFTSLILLIYFAVKASQKLKQSSSYVSSNIQNYVNTPSS